MIGEVERLSANALHETELWGTLGRIEFVTNPRLYGDSAMVKQMAGLPTLIFVGSGYDKDNKTISSVERDSIRHRILTKAAEIFGGATILDANGAWIDDSGRMIEERVFQVIVYSHRDEGGSYGSKLTRFIRFILTASRQTSVLVDDRAYPEAYLVFFDSFKAYGVEHA